VEASRRRKGMGWGEWRWRRVARRRPAGPAPMMIIWGVGRVSVEKEDGEEGDGGWLLF